MRQVYYAFIMLIRDRGANIIKIISLSLGMFIGLLLFARILFEVNYDNHYEDVEELFRVKSLYTSGGIRKEYESEIINEPVPAAIKENFPDEVISATTIRHNAGSVYFKDNHRIDELESIYADSLYFQTMGINIQKGDSRELGQIDVVFISESFARKFYGDDDPCGSILYKDKVHPLTIRGVFSDVPENTTLLHDIVISFSTIHKMFGYKRGGWERDDSFMGYVRLRNPENVDAINQRLDAMTLKYLPNNGTNGSKIEYMLRPVKGEHIGYPSVRMMLVIMGILGIVMLSIAVMNYILISISSLARRSKLVAVHKCNGASYRSILAMFMIEAAVIVGVALLIVFLLFFNFRDFVEDLLYASFGALFTWQTLLVLAAVILIVFLIVGILPGRLFLRVPVTQIFRNFTEKKVVWKHSLLFLQFSGVTFIFSLLTVILLQYNLLVNEKLGYEPENVAITDVRRLNDDGFLKEELLRMPFVKEVGLAYSDIMTGWGGMVVSGANGEKLFTSRWNGADKDYVPLMKFGIKEGRNVEGPGEVLVNEKYVRMMKWTESPVGKPITGVNIEGTIVGVLEDFPVRDRYGPIDPIILQGYRQINGGHVAVRVADLTHEALNALNKKVIELYPQEDIQFITLRDWIAEQYEADRRSRDTVTIASIIIVLITLMGLLGYVNDEIRRRSKEIGIRKINGASVWEILLLISKDVLYMAIPASILGAVGAYFIGYWWLGQFTEQIEPEVPLFILIALLTVICILLCVAIKSWRIANDDPVNSIKNE